MIHYYRDLSTICGKTIGNDIVFPEKMCRVVFSHCCFEMDTITGTDFTDCLFEFCDILHVSFNNCKFIYSSFLHVSAIKCEFLNCYGVDVNFRYTALDESVISNTTINSSKMFATSFADASIKDSDFSCCRFNYCNFNRSDIENTVICTESHVPDTGSFIGWKKAVICGDDPTCDKRCIIKLCIPDDAQRSNASGSKCRASAAYVEDIQDIDGNSIDVVACSVYDNGFKYEKGKTVTEKHFDDNPYEECAPGIHFFLNRDSAVNYRI